jgi:membrane-associated phospholipid phosphatase
MAGEFTVPLDGWHITRWTARIVEAGSNHVDAFPSLHCAVSFYLLMSDRRFKPWRFRVYLLPAIGLWISTIYLRYHYVVDVAAGFALAFACLAVARWQMKREVAKTLAAPDSSLLRVPSRQSGVSS